jgi:hypothetical protein
MESSAIHHGDAPLLRAGRLNLITEITPLTSWATQPLGGGMLQNGAPLSPEN